MYFVNRNTEIRGYIMGSAVLYVYFDFTVFVIKLKQISPFELWQANME